MRLLATFDQLTDFSLFFGALFFLIVGIFYEEAYRRVKQDLLSERNLLVSKNLGEWYIDPVGKKLFRLTSK